jgi:hypothetical protein
MRVHAAAAPGRPGNRRSAGQPYLPWRREGILEYYWGEHIHLGFYTPEERAAGYKKKDFKRAKIDFVDQMLHWSGARRPARVLDVGCGIGGTSRHLAARFPHAHVQGAARGPAPHAGTPLLLRSAPWGAAKPASGGLCGALVRCPEPASGAVPGCCG